ncbi:MAG: phosphate ABC transporter permease subunit PstC [Phycisphaerales bacterium]|nr:phosphate ABC transporter permease subunit PstC [Planctomycetota bacterium]
MSSSPSSTAVASGALPPEASRPDLTAHPAGVARARAGDFMLRWACRLSGLVIAAMLAALILVLANSALPAIRKFGAGFITSSEWRVNEIERPLRGPDGKVVMGEDGVVMEILPPAFGALPVIYGTAATSLIALVVAVPLSLGAALFLVRVAPRLRIAGPVSFLVEFLAAIPSLAFGVWGLFVLAPMFQNSVAPLLRRILEPVPGLHWLFFEKITVAGRIIERPIPLNGRDLLTGSLILAVMILPIITSVSRDVLRSVPRIQIEGTLALGATWWQSCVAMLRYARSGLLGAVLLGLARAAGETMAVTMVIGNNNQISASPFAPAQTMASLLANEFGEATDGMHRAALLYVALILLVMSLAFNVVARKLVVGRPSHAVH